MKTLEMAKAHSTMLKLCRLKLVGQILQMRCLNSESLSIKLEWISQPCRDSCFKCKEQAQHILSKLQQLKTKSSLFLAEDHHCNLRRLFLQEQIKA